MSSRLSQDEERLKAHFLVLRSQLGDNEAFAELYKSFSQRTFRLLTGLLKNDLARDLNQEVWLSVYKRISSLDDPGRFRTWLFQITRNTAIDHFRSSKRQAELYDAWSDEMADPVTDLDDFEVPPGPVLGKVLEELSARLREVVVLNFYEGMDYEEIALILGVSLGTVKSRLFNAKVKIKELIKHKV
ncbi:RNA polymerase sigma factor [Roseivirga sp.]|uniref:RNA polymerase sigma factor n=1 Tax=Roseivirga sp. TaxID=1964215 RepID=UPI003B5185A0